MRIRRQAWLWIAVAALAAAGGALANPQPFSVNGHLLLTGGVGEEERAAIREEAAPFNLWLVLAEEGTGAYVAGTRVVVADASDHAVVDVVTEGPWLLAQLPPGRYTVRTADGRAQAVTVAATGRTMAVLRLPPRP